MGKLSAMKTFVFLFLIVPFIGFSQEKGTVKSFYQRPDNAILQAKITGPNYEIIKPGGALKNSADKSTSGIKYQNDSIYVYHMKSPTDSMLMNKGYLFNNAAGYDTLFLYYSFDSLLNKWNGMMKTRDAYDSFGNDTLSYYYDWDGINSQWSLSMKFEYKYDALQNYIFIETYGWNKDSLRWIPFEKFENIYDASGNKTKDSSFSWNTDSNSLQCYAVTEYYYSVDKLDSVNLHYQNHLGDDNVILSWKENLYYNKDGDDTLTITMFYSGSNDWVKHSKSQKLYYGQSEKSTVNYIWDQNSASWLYNDKENILYNSAGNEIRVVDYKWNENPGFWDSTNVNIYNYDTAANLMSNFGSFRGSLLSDFYTRHIYYYYSKQGSVSQIFKTELHPVELYPNPVHDQFNLVWNESSPIHGQIYNNTGQLVKTVFLKMGNNTFNISNLASGIYYIHILSANGCLVQKIVKN